MKSLLRTIFKPTLKRLTIIFFISLFGITPLVFLLIGLHPEHSAPGNAAILLDSVLAFMTFPAFIPKQIAYKYFSNTIQGEVIYSLAGDWFRGMAFPVLALWCYVIFCLMEFILFGIPKRRKLNQPLDPSENLPLGSLRLGLGVCLALVIGSISWTVHNAQSRLEKLEEQKLPSQLKALKSSGDVETWLNQTYPGDVLKRGAVTQLRQAYISAIDPSKAQMSRAIMERLSDAYVCIHDRFPIEDSNLVKRIESEVLYNQDKRRAFERVERLGAGGYVLKKPALACDMGAKTPEVSHPGAILNSSARSSIRVITPGAESIWQVGATTQVPLSWEMPCNIEVVQFDLYRNDRWIGSLYPPTMTNSKWKNCSGNGRERFTTSRFLSSRNTPEPGASYKVRITSKDGTVYGESGFFTIEKHP